MNGKTVLVTGAAGFIGAHLAHRALVPMQPGDVPTTCADTSALERDFGFKPSTSLRDGLRKFAEWYAKFYMDRGAVEEAGCV